MIGAEELSIPLSGKKNIPPLSRACPAKAGGEGLGEGIAIFHESIRLISQINSTAIFHILSHPLEPVFIKITVI